jgi:hypothetical protein
LLLISNLRAELLDLTEEATIPEVASLREALNADVFAHIESQWNRSIPAGTKRENVWQDVFAPLAVRSTRVYLIDGYLAANLYRGLTATERRRAKSGAEWFLGHLARTSVRFIHLACSKQSLGRLDPERVRETITEWFARLDSGTALDLRIVEGTFPHSRRIAFDGWAGFELHKGIESFDRPNITEQVTLNASIELANNVPADYRALC